MTPLGQITAHSARGLVFGNRGCLHDHHGRIRRTHAGRRWIASRLRFKDRGRELLHAERLTGAGAQRRHEAPVDDLPDGVFVLHGDAPWLVLGGELLRWTPAGYAAAIARLRSRPALVLTPPSTVEVLRRGWRPTAVPLVHPSARQEGDQAR